MRPRVDERGRTGAMPREEARLIELLRSGDLAALDHLVARYAEGLGAYLGRIVPDPNRVEDIVHDTFIKVFENPQGLAEVGSLTAWVFRVARNQALDRVRRTARRERLRRLWGGNRAPTPEPHEGLLRREAEAAFDRALAELPEVFRTAFLLREVEDLSYEQIAAILGCNEKTVSSRLNRARRRLRERLAPFLDEEDAR
ncbi:MAG: RNA polymerase sigma factor [Planctomycetota bacterium]